MECFRANSGFNSFTSLDVFQCNCCHCSVNNACQVGHYQLFIGHYPVSRQSNGRRLELVVWSLTILPKNNLNGNLAINFLISGHFPYLCCRAWSIWVSFRLFPVRWNLSSNHYNALLFQQKFEDFQVFLLVSNWDCCVGFHFQWVCVDFKMKFGEFSYINRKVDPAIFYLSYQTTLTVCLWPLFHLLSRVF